MVLVVLLSSAACLCLMFVVRIFRRVVLVVLCVCLVCYAVFCVLCFGCCSWSHFGPAQNGSNNGPSDCTTNVDPVGHLEAPGSMPFVKAFRPSSVIACCVCRASCVGVSLSSVSVSPFCFTSCHGACVCFPWLLWPLRVCPPVWKWKRNLVCVFMFAWLVTSYR